MPCPCGNCTSGIISGPAQKVAICDLNLVECGAQIPGLGPVTGTIDVPPLSVGSASAQDLIDFATFSWKGDLVPPNFVDAYTTYPTGSANILVDNGATWDIGVAGNTSEAVFRLNLTNPFSICETSEINLMYILLDYTAIITAGVGVNNPAVWVAWHKADNTVVQLVDLAGATEHDVPVRIYVPTLDTITVDDIANGYGLIGMNLAKQVAGTDTSQIQFNYIGARFTYDATSCYDPTDPASGGTRALPVSIVCNSTDANPVAPVPTLDWEMQSGTETVPAGSNVVVNTNPNMHVMSVYNPGANAITVDFTNSAGGTSQQIIPPSSNYTFGVGDVYLAFGTSFTFSNAGGSDIDIIWNVSTTGG